MQDCGLCYLCKPDSESGSKLPSENAETEQIRTDTITRLEEEIADAQSRLAAYESEADEKLKEARDHIEIFLIINFTTQIHYFFRQAGI